jgi:protein HOOK3
MSEAQHYSKETAAFFAFFSTFNLARPVKTVSDLSDGSVLVEILSLVYVFCRLTFLSLTRGLGFSDAEYFRQPTRASAQPSDSWVLRFSTLKRLYRLMTQYFSDVLQCPMGNLEVPDLQAIAKDHNVAATLTMCRMTIAIGVQCERNREFIDKIQGLNETDQHYLMKAIERVRSMLLVGICESYICPAPGHGKDLSAHHPARHRGSQHDGVSVSRAFQVTIREFVL